MTSKLQMKPGQKVDSLDRLEIIQEISDKVTRLDYTRADIVKEYGVTFPTAGEWFKQAALLIAKQDNGLTREGERAIHKGQIDRLLNRLGSILENNSLELEDRLKIVDRVTKALDQRARITGLNVETTINAHVQLKPLQIIRSEAIDGQTSSDDTLTA